MIHVVGLGGVGFWLTVGLTRLMPPDQIQCWDDDTLAGGLGASRLPWGPASTKKVELLTGYLSMVFGDRILPQVVDRKFSGTLGVTEGDTIIDCTDMPITARKRMWGVSKGKGAKLIRVSYDGQGSTVLVSTGLPLLATTTGGYAAVPSLALSLAAGGIGAEAVKRYLDTHQDHFTFTFSVEGALQ